MAEHRLLFVFDLRRFESVLARFSPLGGLGAQICALEGLLSPSPRLVSVLSSALG